VNDDFKAWVAQTVTDGGPEVLLPGNRVRIAAVRCPVELTAEQAVYLAGYVLACAGAPLDAVVGPPEPDAIIGGPPP
jgi:hypothetical protein